MTVEQLPGEIATSTRDREIERFKRSFRIRVQNGDPSVTVDTGDGTQVDIDARVTADMMMPLYAAAKVSGDNTVLEQARGAAVDQWGEREGVGERNEARGATGIVKIQASPGGGTILQGQELKNKATSLRYQVITTDHYDDGDQCGIVGKDTGPATNVPAGTQLQWTSPPPGVGDFVTVLADSSGRGLSGGADKESDDEYSARIQHEKQNRAASGNDSEYQLEAEATPEVAVQKAFTVSAYMGPGTTCVVCTVRPAYPGGSRAPSSLQLGLIESHVVGAFPADDGPAFALLADQPADVSYSFVWAEGAAGWADVVQWPQFYAVAPVSGPGAIRVSAATSATVFTLATSNAVYSGVRQPIVGQTIGFSQETSTGFSFVRKRILSFTGTGPWVITCDTTNNVSDTGYTPLVNQRAMPWSDSLNAILFTEGKDADGTQEAVPASGVLAYFDTLGPGEQFSSFYDEGRRQRRQPRPPKFWPPTLTTRGLIDAITATEVQDVDVLEGDGLTPVVGTPGVLSYILKPRWLAGFPGT
jgi:uncharacterized phage protein gp47/JayE